MANKAGKITPSNGNRQLEVEREAQRPQQRELVDTIVGDTVEVENIIAIIHIGHAHIQI